MRRIFAFVLLLLATPVYAQTGGVVVNRVPLSQEILLAFQAHQIQIPAGYYWYDAQCGAWGMEGGGTLGFTQAGLNLGGPMPMDISGGNTGVYINGRHIPHSDLSALQRLTGPIQQGSYWLDSEGNAGFVGGPMLLNLRSLAGRQGHYRQGGGVGQNYSSGGGAYHNSNTGIGVLTDGQGGSMVFTP